MRLTKTSDDTKNLLKEDKHGGEGAILTDARHGIQSGWLWLLATEFIICSIHWSF